MGKDWIKQAGMEKYENSHKKLSVDFKRSVPCFADIDDTFISMTMETMVEIILKANIWKDIFKSYFSDEEATKRNITDFIKNRNHVAHNKLLNWAGYQKMQQNIEQLDSIIKTANDVFEQSIPSEEQYMTWNIGNEEIQSEATRREWKENYLRLRFYGETGVEIREKEGIYELFLRTLEELYNEFSDLYYFNPQFNMSKKFDISMIEGEQKLFSLKSNAFKTAMLEIVVDIMIDADMDGDSSIYISCKQDGGEIFGTWLEYHNGCGMWRIWGVNFRRFLSSWALLLLW